MNLYGGHAFRVTGAQRCAAMGVPNPTIQVLARWSGSLIMRYVREAPLQDLTRIYRLRQDAKSGNFCENVASGSSRAIPRSMTKTLEQVSEQIQALTARVEQQEKKQKCRDSEYLGIYVHNPDEHNREGGAYHYSYSPETWVSTKWATICGWPYG